jgi:hypothetical protein
MSKRTIPTLLILSVLLISFPSVSASCPEVLNGKYPGWEKRYDSQIDGYLGSGQTAAAAQFNVIMDRVFDGAATFKIKRKADEYTRGSVSTGEYYEAPRGDIRVELHNTVGSSANLSIYTHQKSNLTVNVTAIPDSDYLKNLTGSIYPAVRANEIFDVAMIINNTGEIPAENVNVTPMFDFEIIKKGRPHIGTVCQGEVIELEYTLKAPDVWKIDDYNLSVKLDYFDNNLQLAKKQNHSEFFSGTVKVVGESEITVDKRVVYPWNFEDGSSQTTARVGEPVRIVNKINNTGIYFDFYGNLTDILPEGIRVISGSPTWNGKIRPGQTVWVGYTVTSDVPISYTTYSVASYRDTHGNVHSKNRSNSVDITFVEKLPKIEIEKTVARTKLDFDEYKKVNLDLNEKTNVTVTLKNTGTDTAYDIKAFEDTPLQVTGDTSFEGTLKPEETVSYTYTITGNKEGKHALKTQVDYKDAFKNKYSVKDTADVYVNAPILVITHSFSQDPCCRGDVDVNVTVKNVGSKTAYDIFTHTKYLADFTLTSGGSRLVPILEEGEEFEHSYTLLLPNVTADTTYYFTSFVRYEDDVKNKYQESDEARMTVVKTMPDVALRISGKNAIALDRFSTLTVRVKNNGKKGTPFEISTTIPEGLVLESGQTGTKGELKPGEETEFEFVIKGVRAGLKTVQSTLEFRNVSLTKNFTIKVRGPVLTVNRRLKEGRIPPGEETNVTLDVHNIGELNAYNVSFEQTFPKGIVRKEGESGFEISKIPAGEKISRKYTVFAAYEGTYVLGNGTLKWYDVLGNSYVVNTPELILNVSYVKTAPGPGDTAAPAPAGIPPGKLPPPRTGALGPINPVVFVGLVFYIGLLVFIIKKVFK